MSSDANLQIGVVALIISRQQFPHKEKGSFFQADISCWIRWGTSLSFLEAVVWFDVVVSIVHANVSLLGEHWHALVNHFKVDFNRYRYYKDRVSILQIPIIKNLMIGILLVVF